MTKMPMTHTDEEYEQLDEVCRDAIIEMAQDEEKLAEMLDIIHLGAMGEKIESYFFDFVWEEVEKKRDDY